MNTGTVRVFVHLLEFELELIQIQITLKRILRAEAGIRMRCTNKASAE